MESGNQNGERVPRGRKSRKRFLIFTILFVLALVAFAPVIYNRYFKPHPYPDVVWIEQLPDKPTMLDQFTTKLAKFFKIFEDTDETEYLLIGSLANGEHPWRITTIKVSQFSLSPIGICIQDNNFVSGESMFHTGEKSFFPIWRRFDIKTGNEIYFDSKSIRIYPEMQLVYDIADAGKPVIGIDESEGNYKLYKWNNTSLDFELNTIVPSSINGITYRLDSVSAFGTEIYLKWRLSDEETGDFKEDEVEIWNLETKESTYVDFGDSLRTLFTPTSQTPINRKYKNCFNDFRLLRPQIQDLPALIAFDYLKDCQNDNIYWGDFEFCIFEMWNGKLLKQLELPKDYYEYGKFRYMVCSAYDPDSGNVYLGLPCPSDFQVFTDKPRKALIVYKYTKTGEWTRIYEAATRKDSFYNAFTLQVEKDNSVWIFDGTHRENYEDADWELKRYDPTTGIVTDIETGQLASPYILPTPRD